MRKIRFHHDVVYPYSYMETHALEAAGAVDIEWLPFELRPAPSSTPVAIIPLVPRAD
jgi:hypothetical protein